jgi:hypothetical protein
MCDGVPFLRMTNRGLRWNDWCQEVGSFPRLSNKESVEPFYQKI